MATAEQEGNLSHLHLLVSELGTARERGQIVGDCFGRVVHDLADLRGGLALEREADDLSTMRENRAQIMERAAHRDQHVGVCLAHHFQVTGDGSWGDEEDAIGKVFGSEQGSLTEACWQRSRSRAWRKPAGPCCWIKRSSRLPRCRVRQTVCFLQWTTGLPAGSSAATAMRVILPGGA